MNQRRGKELLKVSLGLLLPAHYHLTNLVCHRGCYAERFPSVNTTASSVPGLQPKLGRDTWY